MRTARDDLKFLNDLARAATGAFGSFGDVRKFAKERVDQLLSQMDLVTRDEFERLFAVAQKARMRQEELEKRIAKLEKQLKTKTTRKKK